MHRLPRRLLTPLVLAASLGVTWLAWQHEQRNTAHEQQAALDFTLRANASRIEQSMVAYEQMLRGVQGLFATSAQVAPAEFRAYVAALQLGANFSGIEGIGLLQIVPHAAKNAHVATMRQRGMSDYAIRPEGTRELYAPLTQLEPSTRRNLPLRGYDPYSEGGRRHAMERARDTNAPFITGKIGITSEAGAVPGFVMFMPLYKKNLPHDTLADRRTNIIGWVSASFRMNKLMAGMYGERVASTGLRIYDGIELAPQALLYAALESPVSADPRTERLEYIEIGGRTWALVINATAATALDQERPRLIALTGLSLGLLLAMLTWMLVMGRERAVELATEMTAALRSSEARYRHLAQHDALTNLPNLALFSDRLQQALAQAKRNHTRLAILFLDLDKFKPVNDALGHQMGDRLLQAVAKRLHDCVRESDTVARIGGDEFVMLLPVIHEAHEALALAELVRHTLDQPFPMDGDTNLDISSSIGVAVYPEHGSDSTQLLKNADQAMYAAKRGGRNKVRLFDTSMAP